MTIPYNIKSEYPDITESMVKMMEHAIGLDYRSPKHSKKYGKVFYPYRNCYSTSSCGSFDWDVLVGYELAEVTHYETVYRLTLKGLDVLGTILGVVIWSCSASYSYDTYVDVLREFCKLDVEVYHGEWHLITCSEVAARVKIPESRVRRVIKKMLSDGQIKKGHSGGQSSDGSLYCRHGYYCTASIRDIPYWRELNIKALKDRESKEGEHD